MENYLEALNPQRSAVVEACAGSGKTWMLVSRILRLLLDGVPPAEILAITFTRLAAREMEERLLEWLTFLAVQSDEAVLKFLVFLLEPQLLPESMPDLPLPYHLS